jgi:hypothetical protein
MTKYNLLAATAASLSLVAVLSGCKSAYPPSTGAQTSSRSTLTSALSPSATSTATTTSTTSYTRISQIEPATGVVTKMPSVIYLNFSGAMDVDSVEDTLNYDFRCADGIYDLTSVTLSGNDVARIEAPLVGTLPAGAQCTLTVSSGVLDTGGNALIGKSVFTYRLPSAGSRVDVTAPVGRVDYPYANDLLGGAQVPLRASAEDLGDLATGVATVQYFVGGYNAGLSSVAPYLVYLDTTRLGNTTHQVTLQITDKAGNVATAVSPINVRVSNDRTVYGEFKGAGRGDGITLELSPGIGLEGFQLDVTSSDIVMMRAQGRYTYGDQAGGFTSTGIAAASGSGNRSRVIPTCGTNKRVSGIWGTSKSGKITSLGLFCREMKGDVEIIADVKVPMFGKADGAAFGAQCDKGQWAAGVKARMTSRLEGIALGCR